MAFIEDILKRTQKAKHYYDADTGKWKAEYAIADQHYHDGSAWQDIDESLADDGLDGFTHKCEKTRHIIRLGDTSTRRWYPRRDHLTEYVEFGRLQGWTGTAWANITLGTPTRTGNKITWSTTNFDLSLTNSWRKIKLEAVLKTTTAKRRLRWAVSLNNLTWDNWQLHGLDDEVAGWIEKPVAWDANGSRKKPNVTLTYDYSGGYVEFGGDLSAAVLPITIDPTFTDGYGGDVTTYIDTYIAVAYPTTNYGTDTYLWEGYYDSTEWSSRSLLKFDLSSIPSGATVTNATLSLYNPPNTDYSSNISTYAVYRQKRAWVESEATWNIYSTGNNWSTAGGFHADDCEQDAIGTREMSASESSGYKSWDLTDSKVQEWISGSFTNNGILIKATTEANENCYGFRSSDYDLTGYRPKLVVEYSIPLTVQDATQAQTAENVVLTAYDPTGADVNIEGSTCWGHTSGVQEGNVRTFAGNWTGTGVISGSSDSEKILLSTGNYMQSEIVNTGANRIELFQNKYDLSASGLLKYRSGSNVVNCEAAEWQSYTGSFVSTGYAQIRVEST